MKIFLMASAGITLALAAVTGASVAIDRQGRSDVAAGADLFRSSQPTRFALAGSKAAEQPEFVEVKPGLIVTSIKGEEIGTVERMITQPSGSVVSFLVNMGDSSAMIPFAHFRRRGDGLVSAMDEATIRRIITEPFIIDAKYQTNEIAGDQPAQP